MSASTQVQQLLTQALDDFEAPGVSLATHVRRATRVAALRKDYVNQLWLRFEVTDLSADKDADRANPTVTRIRSEIDSLLGAQAGAREAGRAYLLWERNRSAPLDGQVVVYSRPVSALEEQLKTAQDAHDSFVVAPGLTGGDLYYAQRNADSGRAQMVPLIATLQSLLGRVRTSLHEFFVSTEVEIQNGQPQAGIFARAQEYVNSSLAQYAPSASAQFIAAQDRLYSGSSEDLAHALTSCRRMIKSLADHLYPATGESVRGPDGVDRKMSDEQYRNRLLEYVRQVLGKHGQGEVMQKTLDSLGARLKSLDSLASTGVHDDVSAAEAETCVVWTYLLAADFLRLADGSSALIGDRG